MAGLIQCHLLQDCVLQHWLQELEGVLDIRHTVGGLYTAGIGKVCQEGKPQGISHFKTLHHITSELEIPAGVKCTYPSAYLHVQSSNGSIDIF